MTDTVREGDHVVLMKSFDSGNTKIVQAQHGTIVHYGKLHFDPSPLIGAEFGTIFEIKQAKMHRVFNFEDYDNELSEEMSKKMESFNEKSQFSQEKIIKRKKKKSHANIVTLIRPNLLLINEMLFARDKIGGLRSDLLAQIITLSNIQSGSKCLVLDHNLGSITSAIMSRILPDGVCIQLLQDNEVIQTTRKTVNMLNINELDLATGICALTIRDLFKVLKAMDSFSREDEILERRNGLHLDTLRQLQKSGEPTMKDCNESDTAVTKIELLMQTLMKKEQNRQQRQKERIEAARILRDKSLDSVILVVQNDHPLPILKMIYPFLAPSGHLVIYSDTIGPLLECYKHLRTSKSAVCINISESWLRKFQILPGRTRPEMNVSGYGGFILCCTKALFGQ